MKPPNHETWSPELEVMTHHLPKPRGFNNEGWITRKSVVILFNADDVIFSMKGGLSPAKASCIWATGSCQDPWIHSPSLKTNVTANLASLLFSLSRLKAKTRRRGKSHPMNDGGVFWYQRPPQQSGGNLMEMSHWMNKTKTSELTHGRAVSARVFFFSQDLFCFNQHSTWKSFKKKTRKNLFLPL